MAPSMHPDEAKQIQVMELEEECFEYVVKRSLVSQEINATDVRTLQDPGTYTCNGLMMHTKKSLTGIKDAVKVDKICEAAEKLLSQGFMTGSDLLLKLILKRKSVVRITSARQALHELLGGGIETRCFEEAFGEFWSGKTQLAHTLCVSAQLPIHSACIDTEGTFRPESIVPIAERFGMDANCQYNLLLGLAAKMAEEPFRLMSLTGIKGSFEAKVDTICEAAEKLLSQGFMTGSDLLLKALDERPDVVTCDTPVVTLISEEVTTTGDVKRFQGPGLYNCDGPIMRNKKSREAKKMSFWGKSYAFMCILLLFSAKASATCDENTFAIVLSSACAERLPRDPCCDAIRATTAVGGISCLCKTTHWRPMRAAFLNESDILNLYSRCGGNVLPDIQTYCDAQSPSPTSADDSPPPPPPAEKEARRGNYIGSWIWILLILFGTGVGFVAGLIVRRKTKVRNMASPHCSSVEETGDPCRPPPAPADPRRGTAALQLETIIIKELADPCQPPPAPAVGQQDMIAAGKPHDELESLPVSDLVPPNEVEEVIDPPQPSPAPGVATPLNQIHGSGSSDASSQRPFVKKMKKKKKYADPPPMEGTRMSMRVKKPNPRFIGPDWV